MKQHRLYGITLGLAVILSVAVGLPSDAKDKDGDTATLLSSPDYEKGELIVKFRSGVPESAKNVVHGKIKALKLKDFPALRMHHVKLRDDADPDAALAAYRDDPAVEYAEPNYRLHLAGTIPNDCLFDRLWGLRNTGQTGGIAGADVSASLAWDITTGSGEIVVGVIDTGIDYDHPDLVGNLWVNQTESAGTTGIDDDGNGYTDDAYGINAQGDTSDPLDDNGHGTHVAGIIGAKGNNHGVVGMNWNVKIASCKAFDQYGSGATASAIECLEYLRTLKAGGLNIVATNNSWGGTKYSQALFDAIKAQRDILFIAAAGNNGADSSQMSFYPASFALPNVLSVAATDHNDAKAYFSNYGRRTVHIGAPGVDIVSLRSDLTDMYGDGSHLVDDEGEVKYYRSSGTSMATPFVTGLAALLKAQDPGRDWIKVKNLILTGGQDIPSLNGKTVTGKRINAHGSMTCLNSLIMSALEVPASIVAGVQTKLTALSINCDSSAGPVTVTTDYGELVVLRDDGLGPDLSAGDGIFTALWTPQADPVSLTFSGPGGTETITLPLLITNEFLSAGITGDQYTQQLRATGGVKPYTWSLSSGALPDGLSLDTATGLISGVPSKGATSTFSITVTDLSTPARSTTKSFSVPVYWKPDLTITSVSCPATTLQGTQLPVTFTVSNQAQGTAGYSRTAVYLVPNPASAAPDIYMAYLDASILGPNDQQTLTVTATVPPIASGRYYVKVVADIFNWVNESNEGNNVNTATQITVGGLPDLIVTTVTAPSTALPGQQIPVSHTVRNQGASAAGNFQAAVYLSTDPVIRATDRQLGSALVSSLATGAEQTFQTLVTIPADTSAGTYYIRIVADDLNAVVESDESNNSVAGGSIAIVLPPADLVVTSVAAPASALPGQQVTVATTVTNRGAGDSGQFSTALYLSADTVVDAGDTLLGYTETTAVPAGGSASQTSAVLIPASLAPGTYYIAAVANRGTTVSESDGSNNGFVGGLFTIVMPPADFVVTSVAAPASALPGQQVTVATTVTNRGAGDSGQFSTALYLSADTVVDAGDTLLGYTAFPSLQAGATATVNTTLALPASLSAGTYYVVAAADREEAVNESDETNNSLAAAPTAISLPSPDLRVTAVSGPTKGAAGQPVTISVTLENMGPGSADSFRTALYLSSDSSIRDNDTLLGYADAGPLAAGSSTTVSAIVTIPSTIAAGVYYIGAAADNGALVAETDEASNSVAGNQIAIGPDLVITSVSASTPRWSSVSVTYIVKNQGASAAGTFRVGFYLSADSTITTGDTYLGQTTISSLAAGSQRYQTTTLKIPGTLPAGIYYIGAIADINGSINESDEANNSRSGNTVRR